MLSVCPEFAARFKCKAGNCTDSCCVGWEIGIDEKTEELYENSHALRALVSGKTDEADGGAVFKLLENGRCPFLNCHGLCDIISGFGEGAIPEICREHPRYYNRLSDRLEWGVGLSCEEAARLITECHDIRREVGAQSGGVDGCDDDECDVELEKFLTFTRGEAYKILYESELTLGERLAALLYYAEGVDQAIENGTFGEFYPSMPLNLGEKLDTGWGVGNFSKILALFSDMDFMDGEFKKKLLETIKSGAKLPALNADTDAYITRIAAYFLHRYFITALWDEAVTPKVKFAVISALSILALSKDTADKEEIIAVAKAYSKEMEYNEENRDAFFDACFTEKELSSKNILSVLI